MKQYIKQPFRCLWSYQVEFALSWSGYTESDDCTFLPVSTFLFCLIFLSLAVMDTFAKCWFGLKSPPESTLARRIKTRAGCAIMTCLAVTISNSSIDRLSCVWYHGLLSPASNSADSHYHHTQLVLLKNIHSFSQSLNPKKRKNSFNLLCMQSCLFVFFSIFWLWFPIKFHCQDSSRMFYTLPHAKKDKQTIQSGKLHSYP